MYTDKVLIEDFNRLMTFIYKGSEWKQVQKTNLMPHVMYRHVVRSLIYKNRSCTLSQIGIIEGIVVGVKSRDHTTILNSIGIFENELTGVWAAFARRLAFYYQIHIAREASIEKKGLIEKTKELLKNSPEMNAFILAKISTDFLIDPEMEKMWNDSTKDLEVSQEFLTQMLNEAEV